MADKLIKIREKLQWWFYGFRVKQWRTTFLLMALMVIIWIFSVFSIPKESSPDIKFWIISITTIYPGVNPQDMDNLITEKIEKEIKDIKWIKKISSTSNVGVSNIVVELENDADVSKSLVDVKDSVDKVDLPSDAEDPMTIEISADNERMFDVILYSKDPSTYIKQKAVKLKEVLEGKWSINRIDIWWGSDSDILVLVNKAKAESLWLSTAQISQVIRSFNRNQPLWSHKIWELTYDFRIEWELKDIESMKNIPINLAKWWFVYLWDISEIKYKQKDERITKMWKFENGWNNYVSMTFNKSVGENIFTSAKDAKKRLESELKKQEFDWILYVYTQDMAELINQDYDDLAGNGLQTLVLVFLVMLLFVWMKEALIATATVPLAFFITFFVLNQLWLSLNFLTNFSLIVCFGIAIDSTIVVIQWAHEKMRQWFNPKTAVLLSVRDYKIPLISGTMTTVVVFLPMMTLPWIMGKFLAYIPITIFITLLASLFISLTLNSALYYKLSKPKDKYQSDLEDAEFMIEEDKIILAHEREWKEEIHEWNATRRDRMLDKMATRYTDKLHMVMKNARTRITAIIVPIVLLILSFVFLSPSIGFTLFPAWDSEWMYMTITAKKWVDEPLVLSQLSGLDKVLSNIPELKVYYYNISDNIVNVNIELVKKDDRKRDSFQIEKDIVSQTKFLLTRWLKLETKVEAWWPPAGKAVWLKLIADSNDKFDTLFKVAKDFELYLSNIPWTKNVGISSSESPWQFVFRMDDRKMAVLGIKPTDLAGELYYVINGISAWALKWKYDDFDIRVKYKEFENGLSANDIQNVLISTAAGQIMMWSVSDYSFKNSITQISRENNKIVIKVESDLEQWITSTEIESQLTKYAAEYKYPEWISSEKWWENQENADLIQAMWVSFMIALFLIFAILLLQFNSYMQPAIIMYSVLLGLLGANIWLRVTGNAYSLSFMIWFIALTWIVVNNAIVLIDRINEDISRWKPMMDAIIETWKSRLAPVLSTTLTTVLWLYSVATQDKFFAGLAYTIMFGLAISTVMTLLIVPAIYYDKDKLVALLKRTVISFIIWIGIPFLAFGWLIFVCLLFWFKIWKSSIFWFILPVGLIGYAGWYFVYIIKSWTSEGQTKLGKFIWEKILDQNGNLLSKKKAIKRLLISRGLFLAPMVAGMVIGWIMTAIKGPAMISALVIVLGYLAYIVKNMYVLWTSEKNELWHDQICGTIVEQVDRKKEEY